MSKGSPSAGQRTGRSQRGASDPSIAGGCSSSPLKMLPRVKRSCPLTSHIRYSDARFGRTDQTLSMQVRQCEGLGTVLGSLCQVLFVKCRTRDHLAQPLVSLGLLQLENLIPIRATTLSMSSDLLKPRTPSRHTLRSFALRLSIGTSDRSPYQCLGIVTRPFSWAVHVCEKASLFTDEQRNWQSQRQALSLQAVE